MLTVTPWLRPLADSTVFLTATAYAALLVLASRAGLFGLWLLILVALSLWRYAYAVLSGVAQGQTRLAPPSIETMNPVGDVTQIAHFLLFPGVVIAIAWVAPFGASIAGQLLAAALGLAVVTVFPASAAILSLGSNLAAALSPTAVAEFIKTLGRDYALLLVVCVGLALLALSAERFVVPRLGLLSALVAAGLTIWTMLGVFVLIGAAVYSHRDDFDIPGERRRSGDREQEDLIRERRAELDLAYASLRSGEREKGYQALRKLVARNGGSVEIQYWLFDNMIGWEDQSHAFRVAERLVARLVEIGDLPAALELYRRCRGHGQTLSIRLGTRRLLRRYAQEIGQAGLASELLAERYSE